MMQLIREYDDKIAKAGDRLLECSNERETIPDAEFSQDSCNRDKYRNLTNEMIELRIRLEVYKEVYDRLVAYFTTNA